MAKKLIDFRFDASLEDAVKAAEALAAETITNITEETEKNIRNLIAQAIEEGIPPYDAARAIQPLIGLTAPQGQAALKYREELINSGLSLDKVNEKVDEYADELLAQRAEMIARTEIMDALNDGQDAAWEQAQEDGLLSAQATKIVILSEDACELCVAAYEGKEVPVGEEFPEGDPPLHPHCRCSLAIGQP